MPHSPVGYFTKQENIAVAGVADMVIRSLLDKQQFHDPLEAALRLGISSASWPLFGLLWPSGARLAERLATRPVRAGERVLEIGCGLALSSLVGHRRGADMTASVSRSMDTSRLYKSELLYTSPGGMSSMAEVALLTMFKNAFDHFIDS